MHIHTMPTTYFRLHSTVFVQDLILVFAAVINICCILHLCIDDVPTITSIVLEISCTNLPSSHTLSNIRNEVKFSTYSGVCICMYVRMYVCTLHT